MDKLFVPEDEDSCWDWQAGTTSYGYGKIGIPRRLHPEGKHMAVEVHRLAYYWHYGLWPGERFVCHKCDNPPCTNPLHLFLGTPAENTADMVHKRRCRPKCKLTPSQVREVKQLAAQGVSRRAIARMMGCGSTNIDKIVWGLRWKGLEDE
jgi:hypothetical protein